MYFKTSQGFGTAFVKTGEYNDGNLAVLLVDDFGQPLGKLSVNLPDNAHLLGKNQFFAKTYNENEIIAQDAIKSGIFKQTNTIVKTGFVECPIWEILVP